MALKLFPVPIPLFSSPNPNPNPNPGPSSPPNHRPATQIRFARWNNANARNFEEQRRYRKEAEDEVRRDLRFAAASKIASGDDEAPANAPPPAFKSLGTPSSPSRPSIPGRFSKYSKPPPPPESHPALRRASRFKDLPPPPPVQPPIDRRAEVRVGEDGVSYVVNGAPFEFKYSYTETPKVTPIRLREAAYSPFGPAETPRPWTGRYKLPASKKKQREFDSFQLPPPYKKGVKPVQAPGPYLPGTGPRYVRTREEILGEPLTPEEVKDLVNACQKTRRQLNMGRDGFTHNMLENIHALWKRKRVCKIKCKGVCTVDMDNVCQQLEEKTGGKIIYRKGGVLYLFRGRNYNARTRPQFPLMLWKPATPVYPKLVQRAPAGLTVEEASDMRKRGRKLTAICKLAKNGMYCNLVHHVREAFEVCELVKIDCQGLNSSDFHKIGAKLRDLVPCVLISFERENILIWRGKEWKSSFRQPLNNSEEAMETNFDGTNTYARFIEDPETGMLSIKDIGISAQDMHISVLGPGEQEKDHSVIEGQQDMDVDAISSVNENDETKGLLATGDDETEGSLATGDDSALNGSDGRDNMGTYEATLDSAQHVKEVTIVSLEECNIGAASAGTTEEHQDVSINMSTSSEPEKLQGPHLDGVLRLWKEAIESGSAVVLVDGNLDADNVYQSSIAFARYAPPGPVFRHRLRKATLKLGVDEEHQQPEAKDSSPVFEDKGREKNGAYKHNRMKGFDNLVEVPHSQRSLGIDELAKLLA